MDLTVSEKLRLIIKRKKIKFLDVAKALGCSRQNLNQKFLRGGWTEESLKEIAEAIGCTVSITFTDKDSGEVF